MFEEFFVIFKILILSIVCMFCNGIILVVFFNFIMIIEIIGYVYVIVLKIFYLNFGFNILLLFSMYKD